MKKCSLRCEEVADFSIRYLTKFIPEDHRISLPKITRNFKLQIDPKKPVSSENLQNYVLNDLYVKAGLLFLKPNEGMHRLIPDTPRLR